jgi:hypothetical protein
MLRSSLHKFLYFYSIIHLCSFHYLVSTPNCLPCVVLGFHMSPYSLPYIGFADGASHSTQSLDFVSWAIYAPTNKLIILKGVFLGRATNNITEYSVVIKLLNDAISLGIRQLDSQLVVLHLSNIYTI